MAKDEIYKIGEKWSYKCSKYGNTEGTFDFEGDAKIYLRLHKIGCKKS